MKEIKQSTTKVIRRSQINLNPVNPKRHDRERIDQQERNLKKVGFLGGIVWNEQTGNVIDGHRRILAMDKFYKYDGTSEHDYKLKVEVVSFDRKTELEQLTYMAVGNTQADIDLVARYAQEVDLSDVGFSEKELDEILAMTQSTDKVEDASKLFLNKPFVEPTGKPSQDEEESDGEAEEGEAEAKKPDTGYFKEGKDKVVENNIRDALNADAYILLSFTDYEAKAVFCATLGVPDTVSVVKGEEVMDLIPDF